jgi:CBS domain-containing protein
MLLRDLCTPDVVHCTPQTTALAAAVLMRQKHVGDLVITDDLDGDQNPIGMVTDRDVVIEVLGKELDPRTVTVREIMRMPVVVARDDEDVSQVLERMKTHGVRRVPVMGAHRKLIGIVCLDDLLKQVAADVNALVDVINRGQGHEHRVRR